MNQSTTSAALPLDRNSKELAQQVLEQFLPKAHIRRIVLEFMVDIIRQTAEYPEAWTFNLAKGKDAVNLIVGQNYLVLRVEKTWVTVFGVPVLTEGVKLIKNDFNTHPDILGYNLRDTQVETWLPTLRSAVLSFVKRILIQNAKVNSGTAKGHSSGVLRYIEDELKLPEKLPDPSHWQPETLSDLSNEPNVRPRHYWRVGTREGVERLDRWPAMRDGNFVSVGWTGLGDLQQRLEGLSKEKAIENIAEFVRSQNPTMKQGVATKYGKQWYAFSHEIRMHDVVVAMEGKTLLGIGSVQAGYAFASEERIQPHHIAVDWKDIRPSVWNNHPGYLTTVFDFTTDSQAVEYINTLLENSGSALMNASLNQILYGPPGTGKTYNTVLKAVQILHDQTITTMDAAQPHWERLRAEERIEFVTFHQSYGYEDFLEGLRPVIDSGADVGLRYEIVDGALKRIALRALGAMLEPIGATPSTPARLPFDMLWERLIEEWEDDPLKTYSGITPKSVYQFSVNENGTVEARNVQNDNMASTYSTSRKRLEAVFSAFRDISDTVSIKEIRDLLKANGHHFVTATLYRELKRIEDEVGEDPNVILEDTTPGTIRAKAYLQSGEKSGYRLNDSNPERYVLVMDEINRGNISKVFGELITLIEDDKRIGSNVALSVTLPLSGERFALPPNLYLIGAMNTADKSIALVDVALRRRFDFVEMMPDFTTCLNLTPIMRAALKSLNHRITLYKDRDHQIGHAFFMDVNDNISFNAVWTRKLVPLLQEYFYNDWDALRAVLGETGENGKLIRQLPPLINMPKARTKWQWHTDTGETHDAFSLLCANYKITNSELGNPDNGTPDVIAEEPSDSIDPEN